MKDNAYNIIPLEANPLERLIHFVSGALLLLFHKITEKINVTNAILLVKELIEYYNNHSSDLQNLKITKKNWDNYIENYEEFSQVPVSWWLLLVSDK